MHKAENYFKVWESYREKADHIYIEKDRGLRPEQITADIAPCEVLGMGKMRAKRELRIVCRPSSL